MPDILMLDRIGGAYSAATMALHGLGGSELELLQVARGLTAKGYSVVVANGVDHVFDEDGIRFVPHTQAWQHPPTQVLYLQRWSAPETHLEIPPSVRVVVRANDVYCAPYNVHRPMLTSGRATLVTNTRWQADQFSFAKDTAIIPPMLEPMPVVEKQPGLFVFASGAMKGFEATVALWCEMQARYLQMRGTRLAIVSPGWGVPRPLTAGEQAAGVFAVGNPTPEDYRGWIAKAEGTFMVLTMPETFCCAAALAERSGTLNHILCRAGIGGLREAVHDVVGVTEDPDIFEVTFLESLGRVHRPHVSVSDLTPSTLIDQWTDVLHVTTPYIDVPSSLKLPPRGDGRPTVGLCIIAKGDEVSTVATRAILSAKKIGVDCVTLVCDTDNATAEVARAIGADVHIRPSPKIDWELGIGIIAGARNEALAIAEERTDYVLMLDADDWFDGQLPLVLNHDAYELTIIDASIQYQRIQLVRSSLHWRYTGIVHETLAVTPAGPMGHLADVRYHRGKSSYGYQDQDPPAIKYGKHAKLLQKWLIDHPDDSRALFYLARSLHDAGSLEPAVLAYQQRIACLGGWEEERSYSAYQIGQIQIQQRQDPTLALIQAHAIGAPKAEPLTMLARWYRDDARRQFSIAYAFAVRAAAIPQPMGTLFLEPGIYQYEAAAEVAICAYWLGQRQEALERFEALLPHVPPERRAWADAQIAICLRDLAR